MKYLLDLWFWVVFVIRKVRNIVICFGVDNSLNWKNFFKIKKMSDYFSEYLEGLLNKMI